MMNNKLFNAKVKAMTWGVLGINAFALTGFRHLLGRHWS